MFCNVFILLLTLHWKSDLNALLIQESNMATVSLTMSALGHIWEHLDMNLATLLE